MNSIKNNEVEKNKCAPSKMYDGGSCFSLESLKLIALAYNNNFPNKINLNLPKDKLTDTLVNRIKECGDNQMCWLSIKWIKNINDTEINDFTFRPIGPQGRLDWLSTTDIDSVMIQHMNVYPDFKFYGAVPIDFAELPAYDIYNINFNNIYNNNITKIGLIVNFDNHRQSGSHWVAIYSDIGKGEIYYFDSYGTPPKDSRITDFIKRISLWCYKKHVLNSDSDTDLDTESNFMCKNKQNKYEENLDVKYNNKRHQKEGTECGVYSINFILRILKGEKFQDICNNITPDKEVNKCRDKYFRNL